MKCRASTRPRRGRRRCISARMIAMAWSVTAMLSTRFTGVPLAPSSLPHHDVLAVVIDQPPARGQVLGAGHEDDKSKSLAGNREPADIGSHVLARDQRKIVPI